MTAPTPLTPAERIGGIILWLVHAMDGPSMYGPFPRALAQLIMLRLLRIKRRLAEIAARVQAGLYVPRRFAARKPRPGQPPPKNPLPNEFGWLLPLVPGAAARGSQLANLLLEPEVAALLAAAPTPLRRPLRSLCHMLAVRPPPILAAPRRPKPVRAEPAPEPAAKPRQPENQPPRARRGGLPSLPPFTARLPDRKRHKKIG